MAQQPKEAQPAGGSALVEEKVPLLGNGAAAPGFRLNDVAGARFSYGEEGGRKPLLLVFFSIFCDPCRGGLPIVQQIQDKYGDGGMDVAAVSLDGEVLKATVAGFARQEGYTFRVLIDEGDERKLFRVAESYRVTEMPTFYLADRGGRIVFSRTGRVAEDDLFKAVQTALKK